MSAVAIRLGVSLDVACGYEECAELAGGLLEQLRSGHYDLMSVMPLTPIFEWRANQRTARKRADRCVRRGYGFGRLDRVAHQADINAINMSATVRQGRPMASSYMTEQTFSPLPNYPCSRHAVRVYGVFDESRTAVAYTVINRAGDLALVSQILGHDAFLKDEVMFLLMQGVLHSEWDANPYGFLVYNRHDSGTDGLREYKERCGFREMGVAWLP